jgi:membrane-bound inhibitor of C-type lysozyme
MPAFVPAALLLAAAATGNAAETERPRIAVTVENAGSNARTTASYDCAGKEIEVEYINVEPDHLAIVPVEGEPRIFVMVISGSGARYASGRYIWWSKGTEAWLYDQMQGGDAAPVLTCTE